jgi:hypothetical protein
LFNQDSVKTADPNLDPMLPVFFYIHFQTKIPYYSISVADLKPDLNFFMTDPDSIEAPTLKVMRKITILNFFFFKSHLLNIKKQITIFGFFFQITSFKYKKTNVFWVSFLVLDFKK